MKRAKKKRKDVTINLYDLPHIINSCIKSKCSGSLMITAIGILSDRRAVGWCIKNVEIDKENKSIKFINDNPLVDPIVLDVNEQALTSIEELKKNNYDVYIVVDKEEFTLVDDWLMYATMTAPKAEKT